MKLVTLVSNEKCGIFQFHTFDKIFTFYGRELAKKRFVCDQKCLTYSIYSADFYMNTDTLQDRDFELVALQALSAKVKRTLNKNTPIFAAIELRTNAESDFDESQTPEKTIHFKTDDLTEDNLGQLLKFMGESKTGFETINSALDVI